MHRRSVLAGLAFLPAALAACGENGAVDLAAALAPLRGAALDPEGRAVDVDAVLAAATGRPASVSFAYVGCSTREPRMARLRSASPSADAMHVVLNAVDEPASFPDLVRDVTGFDEADPAALRVLFLPKGPEWPRAPAPAAEEVMQAMKLRFGRDRFVESVTGIGAFDRDGRFLGVRY